MSTRLSKRVFQIVALASVCGGFYGIAQIVRNSESVLEISEELPATPVDVFRWITEKEKILKWMGHVQALHLPDRKFLTVGDVWTWTMQDRGSTISVDWKVQNVQPWTSILFDLSNENMDSSLLLTLVPTTSSRQTQLVVTQKAKYKMWIARPLEPWIKAATRSKWNEDLLRLKALLKPTDVTSHVSNKQ